MNIPSSVVRTHRRYTGEVLRHRRAAGRDAPQDDIDAKHLCDEENRCQVAKLETLLDMPVMLA